jgi:hypothetical protein
MNTKTLPVVATLAVALVACSSPSSPRSSANLSLSARAVSAPTTPTTPSAPTTSPASLDLGNGILLSEVRVVVRKLKLDGSVPAPSDGGTTAPTDASTTTSSTPPSMSDAGSDGKTEVEKEQDDASEPVLGPVLIDLKDATLASGIGSVFDGVVPQGTFSDLKAAIGPITTAEAGGDQGLAGMASKGASIIIDGTIDGNSFSFVSSMTAELKKEGEVEVSDTKSNNVTLSIDASKWFGGSGTARLDPALAANQATIEANIRASLDAFEDDDKSGHENRGSGKAGGGSDTGKSHP